MSTTGLLNTPEYCRYCKKGPLAEKPSLCPKCKAPYHQSCAARSVLGPSGGYTKCCGSRPSSPLQQPDTPQPATQVVLSRADLDLLLASYFDRFSKEQKAFNEEHTRKLTEVNDSVHELMADQRAIRDEQAAIREEQRAIRDSVESLSTEVTAQFKETGTAVAKLTEQSITMDNRISELQARQDSLCETVEVLKGKLEVNQPPGQNLSMAHVAQEVYLRTLRASNIRLFNVPEGGNDRTSASEILEPLNVRLDGIRVSRLGAARPATGLDAKPRALLVSLASASDANHVLKNRNRLKLNGTTVQVAGDRTTMEQDLLKKARAELEERKKGGESNLTIKYKDGVPTVQHEANGARGGPQLFPSIAQHLLSER